MGDVRGVGVGEAIGGCGECEGEAADARLAVGVGDGRQCLKYACRVRRLSMLLDRIWSCGWWLALGGAGLACA